MPGPRKTRLRGAAAAVNAASPAELGYFIKIPRPPHPVSEREAPEPVIHWLKHIKEEVARAAILLRTKRYDEYFDLVSQLRRYTRLRDRRTPELLALRVDAITAFLALERLDEARQMLAWVECVYGPTYETTLLRAKIALYHGEWDEALCAARYAQILGVGMANRQAGPDSPEEIELVCLSRSAGTGHAWERALAVSPADPVRLTLMTEMAVDRSLIEARVLPALLGASAGSDEAARAALAAYSAICEKAGLVEEATLAARQSVLTVLETLEFGAAAEALSAPSQPMAAIGLPVALESLCRLLQEMHPFLIGRTLVAFVKSGEFGTPDSPLQIGLLGASPEAVSRALEGQHALRVVAAAGGQLHIRHIGGISFDVFLHAEDGSRTDGLSTWRNGAITLAKVSYTGFSTPLDPVVYLDTTYGPRWLMGAPVNDVADAINAEHRHPLRGAVSLIREIVPAYLEGNKDIFREIQQKLEKIYEDFLLREPLRLIVEELFNEPGSV